MFLQLGFAGSVAARTDFQGNQLTHFWLSAFHSTTVASFTKAMVCILKVQELLRPYANSVPVLHHSYRRFSALFVLQVTIAVVEDWERARLMRTYNNS